MGSRAPASKSGRACTRPACGKPNQASERERETTASQIKMCLERPQELRRTTERRPRKLLRPRLPRKITATCKINLNKFWEELEEVYRDTTTAKLLPIWPASNTVEEEQQNNENAEREKLKMELKLPSGRLDRYVFLLPSPPPSSSSSSPSDTTTPSLSPLVFPPSLPSLPSATPRIPTSSLIE